MERMGSRKDAIFRRDASKRDLMAIIDNARGYGIELNEMQGEEADA